MKIDVEKNRRKKGMKGKEWRRRQIGMRKTGKNLEEKSEGRKKDGSDWRGKNGRKKEMKG